MAVQAQASIAARAARPHGLALILTGIIILLAAVASWGGLFLPGLYRDSAYMVTQAIGQDLVTLFVAVPALAVVLFFTRRGSARATLAWIGLLGYMLYTYATYAFGAAFNEFFLIYVVLFSLCIVTMITAVTGIDAAVWRKRFDPATPARPLAAGGRASRVCQDCQGPCQQAFKSTAPVQGRFRLRVRDTRGQRAGIRHPEGRPI